MTVNELHDGFTEIIFRDTDMENETEIDIDVRHAPDYNGQKMIETRNLWYGVKPDDLHSQVQTAYMAAIPKLLFAFVVYA